MWLALARAVPQPIHVFADVTSGEHHHSGYQLTFQVRTVDAKSEGGVAVTVHTIYVTAVSYKRGGNVASDVQFDIELERSAVDGVFDVHFSAIGDEVLNKIEAILGCRHVQSRAVAIFALTDHVNVRSVHDQQLDLPETSVEHGDVERSQLDTVNRVDVRAVFAEKPHDGAGVVALFAAHGFVQRQLLWFVRDVDVGAALHQ